MNTKFVNTLFCSAILITSNLFAQPIGNKPFIKKLGNSEYRIGDILINKREKRMEIPAKINMSKGLIEVVLCTKLGKTHESLLITEISPIELQIALLLLGYNPHYPIGKPDSTLHSFSGREANFLGDSIFIYIKWEDDKEKHIKRVENLIWNKSTSRSMKYTSWLFWGSRTDEDGTHIISNDLTMIATYYDPFAMIDVNLPTKYDDTFYYVNENTTPSAGTSVVLLMKPVNVEGK